MEDESTPVEFSDHITLPIGIEVEGTRYKDLVIDELGGVDEELASNKKKTGGNGAKALSIVLCRSIQEITGLVDRKRNPDSLIDRKYVREMYQVDRDFIISRMLILADKNETSVNGRCKCGEVYEDDVLITDFPVINFPTDKAAEFTFKLPRGHIEVTSAKKNKVHREGVMRFPKGSDQENIGQIGSDNVGKAMTAMLASCITKLGTLDNVDTDIVRRLKSRDRAYLLRMIRDDTPGLRQWREVDCIDCGKQLDVMVDLTGFLG